MSRQQFVACVRDRELGAGIESPQRDGLEPQATPSQANRGDARMIEPSEVREEPDTELFRATASTPKPEGIALLRKDQVLHYP